METQVRLQKLLADAGVASRRRAEEMILAGRVMVGGVVVTEMGYKTTPDASILVDGKPIARVPNKKIYIMLNKPRGVISGARDERGRRTVLDELTPKNAHNSAPIDRASYRLFPVGRLDYNTSGLILITNDGDFAQKVAHPSGDVKKTYVATVDGSITDEALERLRRGVLVDDHTVLANQVTVLPGKASADAARTRLRIVVGEGRNRQVRKMCEAVGLRVASLRRIQIGGLGLNELPVGKWRLLLPHEIGLIFGVGGRSRRGGG